MSLRGAGSKAAPALALALALAAGTLRADPALRGAYERAVLARAAKAGCVAEVWAPALGFLKPGWTLGTLPPLPAPGAWSLLDVPVAPRDGSAAARRIPVRVRLFACVPGWTVLRAVAPGAPLRRDALKASLFDPRSLAGTAFSGPLPAGASAARGLRPGLPLLAGDVADPSSVRAGQRIELVVREGGIAADDEGILLDGGPQGSLLRAQHLRSGKIVRGLLSGHALLVED